MRKRRSREIFVEASPAATRGDAAIGGATTVCRDGERSLSRQKRCVHATSGVSYPSRGVSYPSRWFQSAWMGIIVHSTQSVFIIILVFTLVR
jgi:hypothetical protein